MVEPTRPTRPIVHIGYHKTATTWFQNQVWPGTISHEYVARADTQQALLAPPGMHFDAVAARAALALESRTRPVLLSEENLSGYPHNGGMHGLIGPEAYEELAHDVHVGDRILLLDHKRRPHNLAHTFGLDAGIDVAVVHVEEDALQQEQRVAVTAGDDESAQNGQVERRGEVVVLVGRGLSSLFCFPASTPLPSAGKHRSGQKATNFSE